MTFNRARDGHKMWDHIHIMAANAVTPRKRQLYVEYLNNYKETFPCEECRLHLIKNLEDYPVEPYSNTNVSLFYHSWFLHDVVNGQLNKPASQRLSYEQAFEKYFPEPTETVTAEPQKVQSTAPIRQQERHLASAGHQCTSCGQQKVEFVKRDFDGFRQNNRRVYTAKNK